MATMKGMKNMRRDGGLSDKVMKKMDMGISQRKAVSYAGMDMKGVGERRFVEPRGNFGRMK